MTIYMYYSVWCEFEYKFSSWLDDLILKNFYALWCMLDVVYNMHMLKIVFLVYIFSLCNRVFLFCFTDTARMGRSGWCIGLSIWIPWMMKLSHSHQKHVFIKTLLFLLELLFEDLLSFLKATYYKTLMVK